MIALRGWKRSSAATGTGSVVRRERTGPLDPPGAPCSACVALGALAGGAAVRMLAIACFESPVLTASRQRAADCSLTLGTCSRRSRTFPATAATFCRAATAEAARCVVVASKPFNPSASYVASSFVACVRTSRISSAGSALAAWAIEPTSSDSWPRRSTRRSRARRMSWVSCRTAVAWFSGELRLVSAECASLWSSGSSSAGIARARAWIEARSPSAVFAMPPSRSRPECNEWSRSRASPKVSTSIAKRFQIFEEAADEP